MIMDPSMVNSPSNTISQETFGGFEKHTKGIDYKFMKKMGYDGQWLENEGQEILIPIVAQPRPKYEGLRFSEKEASISSSQTTFFKTRAMRKEAIHMEEITTKNECATIH
jgi:hypothetical protein